VVSDPSKCKEEQEEMKEGALEKARSESPIISKYEGVLANEGTEHMYDWVDDEGG
jgi:hypothetical protein